VQELRRKGWWCCRGLELVFWVQATEIGQRFLKQESQVPGHAVPVVIYSGKHRAPGLSLDPTGSL